jgi:hypothetical protein
VVARWGSQSTTADDHIRRLGIPLLTPPEMVEAALARSGVPATALDRVDVDVDGTGADVAALVGGALAWATGGGSGHSAPGCAADVVGTEVGEFAVARSFELSRAVRNHATPPTITSTATTISALLDFIVHPPRDSVQAARSAAARNARKAAPLTLRSDLSHSSRAAPHRQSKASAARPRRPFSRR